MLNFNLPDDNQLLLVFWSTAYYGLPPTMIALPNCYAPMLILSFLYGAFLRQGPTQKEIMLY